MTAKLKSGEKLALVGVVIAASVMALVVLMAGGLSIANRTEAASAMPNQGSNLASTVASGSERDGVGHAATTSADASDSASSTTGFSDSAAEMTEVERRIAEGKAAYEQTVAPYRKTVALGQTFPLTNYEEAGVKKFVAWSGTLEVTVNDAALYGSVDEARAATSLGAVYDDVPSKGLQNPRLLIMHVTVKNENAIPGFSSDAPDEYFDLTAFEPRFYSSAQAKEAGSITAGDLATYDGSPEGVDISSRDWNNFALAVGETKTLTIGWWVDATLGASDIVVNPSLSSEPGPITFDLGLGSSASGDAAAGDSDAAA